MESVKLWRCLSREVNVKALVVIKPTESVHRQKPRSLERGVIQCVRKPRGDIQVSIIQETVRVWSSRRISQSNHATGVTSPPPCQRSWSLSKASQRRRPAPRPAPSTSTTGSRLRRYSVVSMACGHTEHSGYGHCHAPSYKSKDNRLKRDLVQRPKHKATPSSFPFPIPKMPATKKGGFHKTFGFLPPLVFLPSSKRLS